MKYFLLPFGCATNKADGERIAAMLEVAGFHPAAVEEDANIVGIVACSIRQSAIDRVYHKAHFWNERKKREPFMTFVSGCILPRDEKNFGKIFDMVVKLAEVQELPRILKQSGVLPAQSFWDINPVRSSSFKALIPIQNGCDKFCTYCAVPYTRGREVSRPSDDILREVENVVANGYKQITLLGQNVNSYGLDKPSVERSFAELLDRVGSIADSAPQRMWVHYTSPHPRDMTEEVFDVMNAHPSLAAYLNLPLQSGSDAVLKRMNRRYTWEKYRNVLDTAREKIPGITISTDIIVGFCGETSEQFEATAEAMRYGKYDMAFIAQYSPRPGAVSEKRWEDTVPKDEKKRRDKMLTEILRATARGNNEKLIGQTIPVLVEANSRKDGKLLGRTEGLKSVEFPSSDTSLIGNFVDITIESADAWRLFGHTTASSQLTKEASHATRRYSSAAAAGLVAL